MADVVVVIPARYNSPTPPEDTSKFRSPPLTPARESTGLMPPPNRIRDVSRPEVRSDTHPLSSSFRASPIGSTRHVDRLMDESSSPEHMQPNYDSTSRSTHSTSSRPIQQDTRYTLREIVWEEGDFEDHSFPSNLRKRLQRFCWEYETQNPPCAVRKWKTPDTLYSKSGAQRRWISHQSGNLLKTARFRYGSKNQILLVEAPASQPVPGSNKDQWAAGEPVIMVSTARGGIWKIWNFQEDLNYDPQPRHLIEWQRKSDASSGFTTVYPDHPRPSTENVERTSDDSEALEIGPYKIKHNEGNITEFPHQLRDLIAKFFRGHPDIKLPCANRNWSRDFSLWYTPAQEPRIWRSIQGEELKIGWFICETTKEKTAKEKIRPEKILVAQGRGGSSWERGEPRIIVNARGPSSWKKWTGQTALDDIPDSDAVVEWVKTDEDAESDSGTEDDSDDYKEDMIIRQPPQKTSASAVMPRPVIRESSSPAAQLSAWATASMVPDSEPPQATPAMKRGREESLTESSEPVLSPRSKIARLDTGQYLDETLCVNNRAAEHPPNARPIDSPQAQLRSAMPPPGPNVGYTDESVGVRFIDEHRNIDDWRPFTPIKNLDLLFRNAYSAGIITRQDDRLTINAGGKIFNVVNDLESDFERLKRVMAELRVAEIEVRNGMDNMRPLSAVSFV
jgi:hypothetical protein